MNFTSGQEPPLVSRGSLGSLTSFLYKLQSSGRGRSPIINIKSFTRFFSKNRGVEGQRPGAPRRARKWRTATRFFTEKPFINLFFKSRGRGLDLFCALFANCQRGLPAHALGGISPSCDLHLRNSYEPSSHRGSLLNRHAYTASPASSSYCST